MKLRQGLLDHMPALSGLEVKVYITLLLMADYKTHTARMTISDLCSAVGMGRDSVIKTVKKLHEDEYIRYTPAANQHTACSSFYIFNYEGASSETRQADELLVGCQSGASRGVSSEVRLAHPDSPAETALKEERRKKEDKTLGEFDEFWTSYPRKTGKQKALVAYRKARRSTDLSCLLAALDLHKKSWAAEGRDPKYIPHPATWLNGERWNDEVVAPETEKRESDAWMRMIRAGQEHRAVV